MSHIQKVNTEISEFDYIRFAVCDINGVSRGQVVPSRNAAKYLEKGIDMFQGLLLMGSDTEVVISPHENDFHHGNMAVVPDLDTLRSIPWDGDNKVKVGEILCETQWKKGNSPQKACPRYAARQQIRRLNDLGLRLYSGFEMEYFLFHADTMEPVSDGKLYMHHGNQAKHSGLLFDFDQLLLKSGVDMERYHAEYGPGMFEVVMKPTSGIQCPDSAFNLKQGLQEIAQLKGLKSSFISKLDLKETGVGSHYSFSLLSKDTGNNVFYDPQAPDNLSETAKQWIAGILKHSKALAALTSPTPNCYRRLHQPWAPGDIFWGIEDRNASLRVKNHGPTETYFENRLPSGLSNPYFVVAATLAAGLDGVVNKLECPPQGKLKDTESLPKSLSEALKALESDEAMVSALGEELVTWFLKVKEVDVEKFEDLSEQESIALERKLYL